MPGGYLETMQRKRYSNSTIKSYCTYFKAFQESFSGKDLENISSDMINQYILELIKVKNISISQQNQRINAIKFYYEKVLGRPKQVYTIDRPKNEKKLPKVLSKSEISVILANTNNLKHRMIISLLYSGGLRRSEVIELKISDIQSERNLILIRGAKGKKDRFTILSKPLLIQLRKYYSEYKPKVYLFEGLHGKRYSAGSVAKVVKRAGIKAKIRQSVTPHMLRHSFATHLLEGGTDLRYIQELLGHGSSKTTEIYTRVTNNDFKKIQNPIDEIL